MRNIKDLESDIKVNKIIKKVKYVHFKKLLQDLADLYVQETKEADMHFLDEVIALEPKLKQEICVGNISESEMDYLLEFYGSVTYDEDT